MNVSTEEEGRRWTRARLTSILAEAWVVVTGGIVEMDSSWLGTKERLNLSLALLGGMSRWLKMLLCCVSSAYREWETLFMMS